MILKKYASLIVLTTLILILGLSACGTLQREKTEPDVVFITTPHAVVREMLKLAEVGKDDVVYDLGSGDGRIVIAAARNFGARGVGIEIDSKLIDESTANARAAGVADRVQFKKEDIFKTDLSKATVVTLFLLPGLNKMLIPKLFKELKPGSRVVSHMWDMDQWKPDMTLKIDESTVYFWWIPADVEGNWNLTMEDPRGRRVASLSLNQDYQKLRGSFAEDGKKIDLKNGKMRGSAIHFSLEAWMGRQWTVLEFTGLVEGSTMAGTVARTVGPALESYTWKAQRVGQ